MILAGRRTLWAIHFLLFASGGLALVYELLWMRQFAVVFGANTPAIAATLAALFFGFTLGSVVVGKVAARPHRPLLAYAVLEAGVAIGALLVPVMLRLYDLAYPALFAALSDSTFAFAALKGLLAALALFLPAFCMGGTVPLLGQLIAAYSSGLGVSVAGLYAANVMGAAAGALSVPFVLLPTIGASGAYYACVFGNMIIAGLAWWIAPMEQQAEPPKKSSRPPQLHTGAVAHSFPSLMALAAISGFLFLVLQVSWERIFAQIHENSIYSFSVVLALLLLGLAGGSSMARVLLRRNVSAARAILWSWTIGGLIVALTPLLFYQLTDGLSYLQGSGWASYAGRLLGIALPIVLLPSVFSGMVLPLIIELTGATAHDSAGKVVGSILGANTGGAIAGAVLSATILPSSIGLWGTFLFVGGAMIAAGQFAAWNAPSPALLFRWLALGLIIAAACWMSHGLPRTRLQQGDRLLAVAESSHGVVAVVERGDNRRIKLNNYYVLGGTASTGDERMQAHIPLLLHPKPRRVACLGLGTGITAGASLLHPVEHVTALEIVPEVIAAARHYFRNANLGIDAARMRIVPEDARNFLRASSETFDVIIGDLFVPWRRAEASLYTREHFVAARLSLTDEGLFCQWLPMFQLSETEFNMIAATFLDVFPSCTLWRGDFSPTQPALALVGHTSQGPLDPGMIARRIRELQPDAANPFLAHPSGFWLFSVGPLDKDAVRFTNSRRHLDGKPWLELLGPLAHAGSKTAGELFVGGRLAAFLSEVPSSSLTSQALTKLGPSELQWRQNGFRLAEATQLIQEGKHRAAEEIFADLRRNLPPEVRSLFGDP